MARSTNLSVASGLAAALLLVACGDPEAGGVVPAPPESARRDLPALVGETVEGSLAGGECYVLELVLDEGRYVELTIEQRGIDVATTLEPPEAGEPIRFDAPTGASGIDAAAFVAATAGAHRLEICAFEPDGSAAGSFRLLLGEPRAPSAIDRARAGAFHGYSEGLAREARREPDLAAVAFTMALDRFREAGDRRGEGWTHHKLGALAQARRDPAVAQRHFAESAGLHEELDEPRQQAVALSFLAFSLSSEGRLKQALSGYERALLAAKRAEDPGLLRRTLTSAALIHEQLGHSLHAVELYQARRRLAEEDGDPLEEWTALHRIGKVYRTGGDDAKALRFFEEGLDFAQRHRLDPQVADSLEDIGRVHLDREEALVALGHFASALQSRRLQADPQALAVTLNNLGRCHLRLGNHDQALESFERALHLLQGPASEGVVAGLVRLNLAKLQLGGGDIETPLAHCEQALSIFRSFGRSVYTAGALRCAAHALAARGELRRAEAHIREAVEIVETLRSRSALEELRAHFLESQYAYYELYVDVLVRLAGRHPAQGFAERAFEVAERAKGRILLDKLAEAEAEIRSRADPGLIAQEGELLRRISRLEELLLRERSRGGSGTRTSNLEHRLQALETERQWVTGRIFAAYPGWAELLESRPSPLEEIRAELLGDGSTQLVSFLLGEERSHVWVVDPESLHVEVIPSRERIERLARAAARSLAASDQPHLRVQAELDVEVLGRELLARIAPQLTAPKLILVKDGALHHLPFAALPVAGSPDGGGAAARPMVERFELVEVPSASSAVALRQRRAARSRPAGGVAILADPVFERGDERFGGPPSVQRDAAWGGGPGSAGLGRIAGSLAEAQGIARHVPPEDLFLAVGFEADRDLLLGGRLRHYRIVHLAGHGLSDPALGGLVLSLLDAHGRPVNGLVRRHEIYGLELPADLVVLSACSTGLGPEVRGEGLMGLSRAFLQAGTSQVLASLWDVDDLATARLMEHFYAALLESGKAPALALREAQRRLRREARWSAPHYWAGFVLQGDGI